MTRKPVESGPAIVVTQETEESSAPAKPSIVPTIAEPEQ
jgi:hypothetical protein